MKILLLGGTENSGKSGALIRLERYLLNKGFVIDPNLKANDPHGEQKDFIHHLERPSDGKGVNHIIINTAADNMTCIENLKDFITDYEKQDRSFDNVIIISAIQCGCNNKPRDRLLKYFQQKFPASYKDLIEMYVPHFRNGKNFDAMLQWHSEKVDSILHLILEAPYFNI